MPLQPGWEGGQRRLTSAATRGWRQRLALLWLVAALGAGTHAGDHGIAQFNAVEPLWHYVRVQATHNRYYATAGEFVQSLDGTLCSLARDPQQIQGYLNPFL